MPTVGRVIAQLKHVPLKQIVAEANVGKTLMKATGALTKAGKDSFVAEKIALGLKKNASVHDVVTAATTKMKEAIQAISKPKVIDTVALQESAGKFFEQTAKKLPENLQKMVAGIQKNV